MVNFMEHGIHPPARRKAVGDRVLSGLGACWLYGTVTRVEEGGGSNGEDWIRIEADNGTVICTDHGNVYGVHI